MADLVIVAEVHSGEFGNGPNYARVTIDLDNVKHILHLSRIVKREKVYCMEEFSYDPDFYDDYDCETEWDGNADACTLKVTDRDFYWAGCVKHTDDRWEMEATSIEILKEYEKIIKAKPTELALMINGLEYEECKAVLEARLKGE